MKYYQLRTKPRLSHLPKNKWSRNSMIGKHFTLIELLVTIGIIAVLASLLLPALSKAREKSKAALCFSNMKQLVSAYILYTDDYDGFAPNSWNNSTGERSDKVLKAYRLYYPGSGSGGFHGMGYTLYRNGKYLPNIKIFQCPSIPLYGRYASKAAMPAAYGEYYAINETGISSTGAITNNGSRWLCSSYLPQIFDYEQLETGTAGMTIVDAASYRLDHPNRVLFSDIFITITAIRHGKGHHAAYQDGSCRLVTTGIPRVNYYSWAIRDYFKILEKTKTGN